MKSKEFIDLNLKDLRDSLPSLLANSRDARQFIGIFGGVAGAIVDAAAVLGDEARTYATHEVGRILIDFASEAGDAASQDRPASTTHPRMM